VLGVCASRLGPCEVLNIDAECSCVEPTTLLNIYIESLTHTVIRLQWSPVLGGGRCAGMNGCCENSVAPPDVALTRGGLMVAVEQGRVYLR